MRMDVRVHREPLQSIPHDLGCGLKSKMAAEGWQVVTWIHRIGAKWDKYYIPVDRSLFSGRTERHDLDTIPLFGISSLMVNSFLSVGKSGVDGQSRIQSACGHDLARYCSTNVAGSTTGKSDTTTFMKHSRSLSTGEIRQDCDGTYRIRVGQTGGTADPPGLLRQIAAKCGSAGTRTPLTFAEYTR